MVNSTHLIRGSRSVRSLLEQSVKGEGRRNVLDRRAALRIINDRIGTTWKERTPDYFVRLGILRPPRKQPDHRAKVWDRDYILNELLAVHILSSRFELPLSKIATLAKQSGHNLSLAVTDVISIEEDLGKWMERRLSSRSRLIVGHTLKKIVSDEYFRRFHAGRLRTSQSLVKFQSALEKYREAYVLIVEKLEKKKLEDGTTENDLRGKVGDDLMTIELARITDKFFKG